MTEIKTVGVIGAGQMGAGIAHVSRARRLRRAAPRRGARAHRRRPRGRSRRTWPARSAKGVIDQAGDGRAPWRGSSPRAELQTIGEADLAIEAATENEEVKKSIFKALAPHLRRRHPAGLQHLVDLDHPAGLGHRPARPLHRPALHEPGAADEAGGDHPRHRHQHGHLRDRGRLRPSRWARPPPTPRTSRPSSSTACWCR